MELEQMKTRWAEMSLQLEKQKRLTDTLVVKMMRNEYSNKINKILIPEIIGDLVCVAGLVYLLANFEKLDTWYLIGCGIVSAVILLVLPLLSLDSIRKLKSVNIAGNNCKQTLEQYSRGKIRFIFAQKMSFYLGALLLVAFLPTMGRLMGKKDPFMATRLWMLYALIFPFFLFFSRWVFRSYMKATRAAETILKDLE
jgi:hypothetical protein